MAGRKLTTKKKGKKGKKGKKKDGEDGKKAEERFVEDLLVRGEAAYPDAQGNLPPGATHEIVEEPGGGKPPKVRRRRFSVI
ncbi:MAG TPA: hypothetical protein VH394_18435 [Thermoanaerobaculia bacterium]|jgi:hypothetical protein|nr:hypothetical protein [Thermoanaerobaculia bacterium]